MTTISTLSQWVKRNRTLLLLLLIVALALALIIYDLGAESLWMDEASSIYESTLSLKEISNHTNQPPLYFLILNLWIQLWGTSETGLRSLSALFGVLAIIVTYLVGKELFNEKVALLSSFISAISQFYIYFSQEARGYSLLLLLSLISYLIFIKIIKRSKAWYFPCYFVANVLLGYTHVHGLFIIISQLLYGFIFWKRSKALSTKLLLTWFFIIASLTPLIILLGERAMTMAQSGFWISQPSLRTVYFSFREYATGFWITPLPQDGVTTESNTQILKTVVRFVFEALFFVLAAVSLFSIRRSKVKATSKKSHKKSKTITPEFETEYVPKIVLLLIWLFIPIGLPFVASQFVTPIYLTRYTIGAVPAFYFLVAQGMSMLGKKSMYTTLIVTTVLASLGLSSYYIVDIKEQWREAALLVQDESKDNDIIVFSKSYIQRPFDYYYKNGLDEFSVSNDASIQEIDAFIENIGYKRDRLWLIVGHENQLPPVYDNLKSKYRLIEWSGFRSIIVFLFDLNTQLSK